MRSVLSAFFLCLTLTNVNAAESPEDAYIVARDAAIAKIKALEAKKADDAADKAHKVAVAELEKRLQPIIGELDVAGFPKKGTLNLDSLSDEGVGFGMLDGLRFSRGDDAPQAVVTTDGLLDRWLRTERDWWKERRKSAPSQREAFQSDEFYTFAIGSDAAFTRVAELPITKPSGATYAAAILGGWAQDYGPNPAQEIVVTLQKGGKTYFVTQGVEKLTKISACEAIWKTAEQTAIKAKDSDAITKKGDADYRSCVGKRLPKEAIFPELVKKAQALVDKFAGQ